MSLSIVSDAHTAWSVRDGSLKGGLTSVTQTKDGYLWLGTGLGLLRFDGVRFLLGTAYGGIAATNAHIQTHGFPG